MKIIKKLFATCFLLTFCVMSLAMTASAQTKEFDWYFKNVTDTSNSQTGYKNDNEQRYYITINWGNVAPDNKLGTRIRKVKGDVPMSSYELHTSHKKSQRYSYNQGIYASMDAEFLMRAKKDDSSSNPNGLSAAGKVTF